MRRILPLSVLTSLVLSACAPGGSNNSGDTSAAGTTGYYNSNGVPYVSGGDPRMEEARNQPIAPSQPKTPDAPAVGATPAKPGTPSKPQPAPQIPVAAAKASGPPAKELRERLKEFEISRFNANETAPSRFGNKTFVIKFWFPDEDPVEFRGEFQGQGTHFSLNVETPKYSLRATFDDLIPSKSEGDLYLTDKTKNEIARILYSAYKAKLTVHQDRLKPINPGTTSYQQVKDLQENTFGWVNNWSVVQGPAFYLVDIVRVGRADRATQVAAPILAFKGESLRTGDQDHPAQSLTPTVSQDISLIGNSESAGQRWFEATLGGTEAQDQNKVVLDIQEERPQTQTTGGGSEPAPEDLNSGSDDTVYSPPGQPVQPSIPVNPARRNPPAPAPRPGASTTPTPSPTIPQRTPPAVVEPVISGSSYFKIDMSKPRTARISNDFARNRDLKTVQRWMLRFRNPRDGNGINLNTFYKSANPFRPMIEAIGRAYDVSPAFAYLTIVESQYLTGGRYTLERQNSVGAWGAFQMKPDTARGLDMRSDERGFFAPSACGAAKYIRQLTDQFSSSDATMAILGYFQGGGGAARAAVCALRDKSACGGHNFNRYVELANFGFTYAQMDDKSAIPTDQREYVERILAIYFVSSDMQKYEMTIDPSAPRSLPTNGTVMPTTPIQDATCRAAVQSL